MSSQASTFNNCSATENEVHTHFSLSSFVANILNPIPLTKAVLNVMSQEEKVAELESENSSLRSDVSYLEEHIHTLVKDLVVTQELYRQCQSEVVIRNQTNTRLQERIDLLQQQNAVLKQNNIFLASEYKQQVIVLENQLEESQDSVDLSQQGLEEYQKKYQDSTEK